MKTVKLTAIKTKKRQTIILKNRAATLREFCVVRGGEQPMLPAASAARLLDLSERRAGSSRAASVSVSGKVLTPAGVKRSR